MFENIGIAQQFCFVEISKSMARVAESAQGIKIWFLFLYNLCLESFSL